MNVVFICSIFLGAGITFGFRLNMDYSIIQTELSISNGAIEG